MSTSALVVPKILGMMTKNKNNEEFGANQFGWPFFSLLIWTYLDLLGKSTFLLQKVDELFAVVKFVL